MLRILVRSSWKLLSTAWLNGGSRWAHKSYMTRMHLCSNQDASAGEIMNQIVIS